MEKVKLSDICTPKQWKTIPTNELLEDGYPVYGANGIIGYYNEYNHEKSVVTITCRGATCGSINITVPKSYVTGNAMCLDNVRDDINQEYLYYCLLHYDFNSVISGSAQPQITRQGLENVFLNIGTHEEQVEIVKELKCVESVVKLRKKELCCLDELIKARFVELFGDPVVNPKSWETALLSNLIIKANNGMARRGKDEEGSIVLRLVELQNGFIDYSAPNRICLNETEKKRYELVDNDFLFARVNGNPDYVGRCAVFKSIDEPVFHNDHIIRVHFNEAKINGCYMSVLLNSDYGK